MDPRALGKLLRQYENVAFRFIMVNLSAFGEQLNANSVTEDCGCIPHHGEQINANSVTKDCGCIPHLLGLQGYMEEFWRTCSTSPSLLILTQCTKFVNELSADWLRTTCAAHKDDGDFASVKSLLEERVEKMMPCDRYQYGKYAICMWEEGDQEIFQISRVTQDMLLDRNIFEAGMM